jgi:phosphatidylglycerol:prolipoprotein diacylglycerol transferase
VSPVYPLFMLAAVGTGLAVARAQGRTLDLSGRQRLGLALGAFVGAMLGAKLPFLFQDWDRLASGAAWLDGGKTITTGLVGGYFGVEVAKRALGLRVKTGDAFAVPVAAAVAVGRLACLAGGCCFGTPTALPWGLDFGDGVRRHPTQLYEFAFHLTAAFVLAALRRRGRFPRQLIKLYVIAYLVFRFATEAVRPEPVLALGLTVYQWAAVLFVPLFAFLWWRDARAIDSTGSDPSEAVGYSKEV